VVWSLGFTSLLTDISAEMVNSTLPAYLVLHLHLSPLQYGAVDAVYNGLAVAIVSLAAGLMADRRGQYKAIAMVGYGASAACKLLLLAAAGSWGWITAITGLDRLGKGIRTAPRDALISLNTPRQLMATAFAVHRALDAGGSLLGPIVAFGLLATVVNGYDLLWVTSFFFAVLGLAVLYFFVPRTEVTERSAAKTKVDSTSKPVLVSPQLLRLGACALILSIATVSDGFIYLLLQRHTGVAASYFPLFYVVTATAYMAFSIPVGRIADRVGRRPVLIAGYGVLASLYCLLLFLPPATTWALVGCLLLFGLYYASTEGVLMAMASTVIPASRRAGGLAVLVSIIGVGKMIGSVSFGWLWDKHGSGTALQAFLIALGVAAGISAFGLKLAERR
jgi:MFS family permease